VRGKALYRDIYFDKPPAIALVYAGLFKLFGAHILTIRLFTIVYSIAMSAMLYVFGKRFYGERIGLIAAAMFAIFSTIFTTGHVQGLNTDLLMTLPYTAGAYWLMRSRGDVFRHNVTRRQSARLALAGGAGVGIAIQVNPKGVFGLAFFALFLLLARLWQQTGEGKRGKGEKEKRRRRGWKATTTQKESKAQANYSADHSFPLSPLRLSPFRPLSYCFSRLPAWWRAHCHL